MMYDKKALKRDMLTALVAMSLMVFGIIIIELLKV